MGHETGDVALAVADSSDIVHCSVGIAGVIVGTVGSGVAENHLAVLLELSERSLVAMVIAVRVRDGNLENLAPLGGVGRRRVRLLDTDVHVAADESQSTIAHHRAGKQAGFAQNLEAVADAQDRASALREFLDGLHHRRKGLLHEPAEEPGFFLCASMPAAGRAGETATWALPGAALPRRFLGALTHHEQG